MKKQFDFIKALFNHLKKIAARTLAEWRNLLNVKSILRNIGKMF